MLQSVMLRLGLRYISRRFFQSVLFIIGVALGVAVVIAIDLANVSANRAFALSAQSVTGNATHQISGGAGGLPTSLYREIRLNQDIRLSAPVINEYVRAESIERPLRLLGVDPFAEPPFRDYLTEITVIGADDENIDPFTALNRFIAEPDTVLISQTLADDLNVSTGETITLSVDARPQTVQVIGVMQPANQLSQQALNNLLLTDISTAQELTENPGRISRIDLILPDDYDTAQLVEILPPGAVLNSANTSSGALQQMTAAFEINLQALSLLAVVVGVFLIYNTVSFSVVQRRPVIGILRSVGATKRQIFVFITGEAFILGALGTLLGLGLGVIFGRFTVGLVSQTISDLYFSVNVTTVTLDSFTLIKGVALGLAASIGAAVIPSIDATRTPPAGSMKRSSLEERTAELVPYISAAAVAFCVIGVLLLQIPTNSLVISFSALFAIILGGALFTPLLLRVGMQLFTPLTSALFGVLGRMAPRAVTRSLSRTSVAVAALTIAVSVIIGVSTMIGSFRNTVSNWLQTTLVADIYISPPGLTANQSSTDVNPMIENLVGATDGIERVATSRTVQAVAPAYPQLPPVNLNIVDFDLAGEARGFVWKDAETTNDALQSGQIMVSEPFAFRRNITPDNNTLTLITDEGEQTFEIFGVFYDYTTDQGIAIMSRDTYGQYWNDESVSAVAAFIEDGADLNAIIIELETETLAGFNVEVQSNRALRENVFAVFERTFTITVALRLLATLVAFIGILSALMSLQLEHTREYGVMRATGMTPFQLRSFTFIQTGLMGTIAGILAVPIGIVLALVLIYVINVRSFGWTMQFNLIPEEIALAFGVAIGAALLAGIYPAYKLARMNVSRALRSE